MANMISHTTHSPEHGMRHWICQCGAGNAPGSAHCHQDKEALAAASKVAKAPAPEFDFDFALWVQQTYDRIAGGGK